MVLLRIPFLISVAAATNIAITSPNPPPDNTERLTPTGSERFIAMGVLLGIPTTKVVYWSWTMIEIAVIVAVANAPSQLSTRVLNALVWKAHPVEAASQINMSLSFLVGCLLAVAGGIIRLACYRELGTLFTFELSIRKDHKLITSGPYAYVRHPSYAGLIFLYSGWCLCHLSPGSWLRECSGLPLHGNMSYALVTICFMSHVWLIVVRTQKEDEMLRKEFRDWDDWAKRVPYCLIPYIF